MAAVNICKTPFGEEVVEFLHGLGDLQSLKVMVLSESGWGWALSWTQLGVRTLQCIAFSDQSMDYGRQLSVTLGCRGFELTLSKPHEASSIFRDSPFSCCVVCGHVPANPGCPFLDFVGHIHPTVPLLFTLPKDAVHHFVQR